MAGFVAFIAWFVFVRSGMVQKSVEQWVAEQNAEDGHQHTDGTHGSSLRVRNSDDDEDEEEPSPKHVHSEQDDVVEYIQSEFKEKKPQLEEAQSGALISVVQGLLSAENGDPELGNGAGTEMTSTANGDTAVTAGCSGAATKE